MTTTNPLMAIELTRHREVEELDDAKLAACRARDPVALRWWVTRYERLVFAFLSRSLGAGPHVEDLAQEVFVRAFQALDRFDPAGPARFSTWLLGIARRVGQEARRQNRILLEPLDEERVAAGDLPDLAYRRREIAGAFERAASQLPEDQRDAFVLAEFHGLTMAEVGEVLGIPESTAKTRLFRAREKLRALLAPMREA